jgi:hypothetical protein
VQAIKFSKKSEERKSTHHFPEICKNKKSVIHIDQLALLKIKFLLFILNIQQFESSSPEHGVVRRDLDLLLT